MTRLARSLTAAAVLLAAVPGAILPGRAMTKGGVTMADTLQVDGATLQLNGIGIRTFTVFNVRGYVAALYLATKTTDAGTALSEPGPKALILQFAREASQTQVHDLYMQSSTQYCADHACTASDRSGFAQLLATAQAVHPGDRTSFIARDASLEVRFDDRRLATIAIPGFGRIILDSDLGPTAPSRQLRDGLLGKGG